MDVFHPGSEELKELLICKKRKFKQRSSVFAHDGRTEHVRAANGEQ